MRRFVVFTTTEYIHRGGDSRMLVEAHHCGVVAGGMLLFCDDKGSLQLSMNRGSWLHVRDLGPIDRKG